MKIECIREKLANSLQKIDKIASKNSSLPILKCVLINARAEGITVTATNLELGVEIEIQGKVIQEGKVAVPAGILSSLISQLSNEKNITLELEEGILRVSGQKALTTIKTISTEDFPPIPHIDAVGEFKIDLDDLIKGLKSVCYASAISSIKPEYASIRISEENGEIFFVATDAFRLAEKRIKTKLKDTFKPILIPSRNVIEIIRLFDGVTGEITISIGQNQIGLLIDQTYVISRTIDGNYPNYQSIIPKEYKTEVTVFKADIANALKIGSIFSDQFNRATLAVYPDTKTFTFVTKNNDVGENNLSISAVVKGDKIEMNFNHRHIADVLQSITSDQIDFLFSDVGKPLIVRGHKDGSFTYLVMPMNK